MAKPAASNEIPARPRAAFSIAETCLSLDCSRSWLYDQLAAGTIQSLKLGGRRFIPAAELDRIAAGRAR